MHTSPTWRQDQYESRLGGQGIYTQPPQPPPSPPMEDTKCSLPSISNLLGLADAGSPASEASLSSRQPSPHNEAPAASYHQSRQRPNPYGKVDSRPSSSYGRSSHRILPPTPPMTTEASFDNHVSPTKKMTHQPHRSSNPNGFYYETTPPLEADMQRHVPAPLPVTPAHPAHVQVPYTHKPAPPIYATPAPPNTYYTPVQTVAPQPPMPGLYYQRPLPQSFPPPVDAVISGTGANPWQHHHYLNPSGGASYPQSQDRYICQTCNKAFSRPSSLRIHSHSHTGEKPFKCPHAGCGKAFSVRSNMKRHERGCHSFEVGAGGPGLS